MLLHDRIDVGIDWIGPRRSASIAGNRQLTLRSADGDFSGDRLRTFFVPELGYRRQLGEGLSFGLALYGNGGLNTDYTDNPYAGFGSTGNAGVDLAQLFVSPALAWQIGQRNAIGLDIPRVGLRFQKLNGASGVVDRQSGVKGRYDAKWYVPDHPEHLVHEVRWCAWPKGQRTSSQPHLWRERVSPLGPGLEPTEARHGVRPETTYEGTEQPGKAEVGGRKVTGTGADDHHAVHTVGDQIRTLLS